MKKIILTFLSFILISNANFAQNLTTSPLSRYGIGDILQQGNTRQLAMGNTGIADYNPLQVSKINPAGSSAYTANRVVFEFGAFHKTSFYSYNDDSQINNVSNFNYLLGGFRINKWWHTSLGLVPYSAAGYQIIVHDTLELDYYEVPYSANYSGNGSINQIFWGNSVTFFKKLALGVNLTYNFGSFDHKSTTVISDTLYTSLTAIENRNLFHKITYDFGILFNDTLKKGNENILRYSVAGIFNNKFDIKTNQTRYVWRTINAYNNSFTDSVFFDTIATSNITIPMTFGGGISLTYKDKLTFNADYIVQKFSNTNLLGYTNFVDSRFIGAGFEYCTDQYSTDYFKTIKYRLGGYMYNSYKLYNNYQVNTKALTAGIGFPVKYFLLNAGFQFGQTNAFETGLNENFIQFNLGVSLIDLWFIKRKFN